jgi:SAM-dependent methyltransferase
MNILELKDYLQKPEPFEPGEPLFWDDPHISEQMLAVHLDPNTDLASRRPEMIEQTVNWLVETLGLKPGEAVLDLGCGPGLYATRFARHGLAVTGVDYSQRSIDYATEKAREDGLAIEYYYQNYLDLAVSRSYRAAFLIYGDFCPLSPEKRARLLENVHSVLEPGGFFVLDVSTKQHRAKYGARNHWTMVESGFWKPGPHLVLEEGFDYPEQGIYLDQYMVIEADGRLSVYRNWFQDYDLPAITAELGSGGFRVKSAWGDLSGAPLKADSEWIGIVAEKV